MLPRYGDHCEEPCSVVAVAALSLCPTEICKLTSIIVVLIFVQMFAREMPYAKFILPTAPAQPVTMNMGMRMNSWYDIVGLDERSNENCKGIVESRAMLEGILAKEHADTGLPYSRMVLAGFSQGGALSLFTGLQLKADQKLAGVVVLSGYLPAASQFTITPGLEDVPVWHGHGDQDMMVRPELADKSREAVLAKGLKSYEIHKYPCGHTVDMDELQATMAFLKKVLPPDDSCRIQLKDPANMSIKELKAAIRKAGLNSQAVGFTEKREFIELIRNHRDGKL